MKVDLSFSHPQLHPIEDAGSGVLALELVFGTIEVVADLAERANPLHREFQCKTPIYKETSFGSLLGQYLLSYLTLKS